MAWSYDETALDIPLNAVRLTIGDTNPDQPQLQDEEIESFILDSSSVVGAARMAVAALMAKYSRDVDKWVGDLKILASQRLLHYERLAKELATTAAFRGYPSAGGVYRSQKEAQSQNTDLVSPFFRRGMHDNRECD